MINYIIQFYNKIKLYFYNNNDNININLNLYLTKRNYSVKLTEQQVNLNEYAETILKPKLFYKKNEK
jgi:hypothetical protein